MERARQDATRARQVSCDALDAVWSWPSGWFAVLETDSQALLREITGQGPERHCSAALPSCAAKRGKPPPRVSQAIDGAAIEIESSRMAGLRHHPKTFLRKTPMMSETFKQAYGVLQQHAQTLSGSASPTLMTC